MVYSSSMRVKRCAGGAGVEVYADPVGVEVKVDGVEVEVKVEGVEVEVKAEGVEGVGRVEGIIYSYVLHSIQSALCTGVHANMRHVLCACARCGVKQSYADILT